MEDNFIIFLCLYESATTELDSVQYNVGRVVGAIAGEDANLDVVDRAVCIRVRWVGQTSPQSMHLLTDERDRANSLWCVPVGATVTSDVEADGGSGAIPLDVDVLPVPAPAPDHLNCCHAVGELDIPGCVLLRACALLVSCIIEQSKAITNRLSNQPAHLQTPAIE